MSVVGIKTDVATYSDVQHWKMNRNSKSVKENNDHYEVYLKKRKTWT